MEEVTKKRRGRPPGIRRDSQGNVLKVLKERHGEPLELDAEGRPVLSVPARRVTPDRDLVQPGRNGGAHEAPAANGQPDRPWGSITEVAEDDIPGSAARHSYSELCLELKLRLSRTSAKKYLKVPFANRKKASSASKSIRDFFSAGDGAGCGRRADPHRERAGIPVRRARAGLEIENHRPKRWSASRREGRLSISLAHADPLVNSDGSKKSK